MVICCYTEINEKWTESELYDKLKLLPEPLQIEAMRKQLWIDRQLSVTGKLLIKELLVGLGVEHLSLKDIRYSGYRRPSFDSPIDFNIAHSENYVICCGTDKGRVGVDSEQIKPIELDDYLDYFTSDEWQIIRENGDPFDRFYEFWTRKEAVVKAIGTGLQAPLSSIDVSSDKVVDHHITYHIKKLSIAKGYQCHLASTEPVDFVKLQPVLF